ncbi:MAG: 2-succinyl-5-enolpyruvyl-6-hydroxy-3-cyclohexene-1-carboxylic-acid synthase [Bacteroidia bacterium]
MQQHVFVITSVLKEAEIEHAVICPGSRCAPLVFALLNEGSIRCHSVTDERTAGFVALGIAIETQKPVVLVCTSGTAALNFFPAIAEAFYQKIPLIVLTADRPPELLNQQDGQMIMQKGVYGQHVLASHELPCFEDGNDVKILTEKIVFQSLRECLGFQGPGPIHINVPLREPLYPLQKTNEITLSLNAKEQLTLQDPLIQSHDLFEAVQAFKNSQKRLIILGLHLPDNKLSELLTQMVSYPNTVLIADIGSNQQHLSQVANFDAIVQYANTEQLVHLEPDFILSFGGPLVSKALKNWLKKITPKFHFRIQSQTQIVNTYNNVTHSCIANPIVFLQRMFHHLKVQKPENDYLNTWLKLKEKATTQQQQFLNNAAWFEPKAVDLILKKLPDDCTLHLGNSSVIRFASWLGINNKTIKVQTNRGTSGIDGCISTAIGCALADEKSKHILLVGDLSFWYDSNAFWLNQPLPENLIVFVFNNGEGGIFNWIDGPSNHPDYLKFFTTPTNRNIKLHTQQFNVEYLFANNEADLKSILKSIYNKNKTCVVELAFTNPHENYQLIKKFKSLSI